MITAPYTNGHTRDEQEETNLRKIEKGKKEKEKRINENEMKEKDDTDDKRQMKR